MSGKLAFWKDFYIYYTNKYMMKRGIIGLILFASAFFLVPSVLASDIAVWQGQYFTGTTFNTGTYDFNFTVYDALTGGNTCYSNTTTLTTGNFGEWKTEQNGVGASCNNLSQTYFLNINIDEADQTPRKRLDLILLRDSRLINTLVSDNLQISSPVITTTINQSGTGRYSFQNLNSENTSNSLFSVSNDLGYLFSFGITSSNYFSVPNNRSFANQPSIGQSSFNDMYFVNGRYTGFSWLNNPLNDSSNLVQYLMSLDSKGNLNVTGNITATYFIGDGSLLTGINSSSANLTNYALKNQSETFAGNVTTTQTGFFGFLGSLTSRVTKLFVQDIDASGNVNVSGNITGNEIYGEMWFHNDTVYNITIISSSGTFYNVSALGGLQGSNNQTLNGFTFTGGTTGTLTAQVDGLYKCGYSISGGGSTNQYRIIISKNNIPQVNTEQHVKSGSGSIINSIGSSGFIRLSVGDMINLQIQNADATNNFEVNSVNLNCVRIGN